MNDKIEIQLENCKKEYYEKWKQDERKRIKQIIGWCSEEWLIYWVDIISNVSILYEHIEQE